MRKVNNPTAEGKRRNFFAQIKGNAKRLWLMLTTMLFSSIMTTATAFASSNTSGSSIPNAGEEQFNAVIRFFATWIGRIGLVVGFIGAIMFALAIKNDDAEAKTRGLMTLASGFVVFAVTMALDMFGIT